MWWTCPLCPSRKQGPEKPRLDATVRFCLSCSAKSDRLVKRVCLALEKKREKLKASRKASQDRKRETQKRARERKDQQADQKFLWAGADLRVLWAQMQELPFAAALLKKTPTLKIRQCSRPPRSQVGVCWYLDHRVQVSVWKGLRMALLVDTMIHELSHLVSVAQYGDEDGTGHKHAFKTTYSLLIREWKRHHPEVAVHEDARYIQPRTL